MASTSIVYLDASIVYLDAVTHAKILLGTPAVSALLEQLGREDAEEVCKHLDPNCPCETCAQINLASFDKMARWLEPAQGLRTKLGLPAGARLPLVQGFLTLVRGWKGIVVLRSQDPHTLNEVTRVLKACRLPVIGDVEDPTQLRQLADDGKVGVVTSRSLDVAAVTALLEHCVEVTGVDQTKERWVVDRNYLLGHALTIQKKALALQEDKYGRLAEERIEAVMTDMAFKDEDDTTMAKALAAFCGANFAALGGSQRPQDAHLRWRSICAVLHKLYPLLPLQEIAELAGYTREAAMGLDPRACRNDRVLVGKVANGKIPPPRDAWSNIAGKALAAAQHALETVEKRLNRETRKAIAADAAAKRRKVRDSGSSADAPAAAKRRKARNSGSSADSLGSLDEPLA